MKTKFLALSIVLINSISCHKQIIPTKVFVSNIEKIECKEPETITEFYTYYQGEKIDFDYTPIALISVIKGNQQDSIDLKSTLKYNAALNCADAVINLNQSFHQGTYKQTNYFEDKYSSYHIENMQFDMLSYHGLAVKLETKNNLRKDKLFVNEYLQVRKYMKDQDSILINMKNNRFKNRYNGTGTVIGIGSCLAAIACFFIFVKP